ncbi:MAG: hypothetical protein FJ303_22250 [Planctomycetes bacterium]|nr:hypothetical protein [Planctomycetota bacterium]
MPDNPTPRYFLTMYGYQTFPNFLRTAHTFGEVTRKKYLDDGSVEAESTLISWLPAGGKIHLFGGEPGRNYTMDETLAWAADVGAEVRATEPTEIMPELYDSFIERRAELDSGSVLYIMNDRFTDRPNVMTNCIHAISDLPVVLAAKPMLDTGIFHGYLSSWAVYDHLSDWFVESPSPDPDVTPTSFTELDEMTDEHGVA